MARVRPKLASIFHEDDFGKWLAETIQEKAAKENAGFVQVEYHPRTSSAKPHLMVKSAEVKVAYSVELSSQRVSA
jgi:hypothetical protein